MKKHFIFILVLLIGGATAVNAQGMRRTPEERTKRVVDTLTSVFKLDKSHSDQVDSVFLNYYKDADKMRESMQSTGSFDRDAFMKLNSERDEKLKKVLTDDQFKKFKEDIEPAMRPQRRGGGGNGR